MGYFNDLASKQVINRVTSTYSKIQVKDGVCRYNHRCQYNSVHDAINDGEDKVAMCLCVHGDYCMIHFVNVSSSGEFTDNTLGHWGSRYDYYLIKYINKDDFFDIDDIFISFRKELKRGLSFWVRLFNNEEF